MGKKILLIDDEPALSRSLSVLLEKQGFEIIVAEDGLSGLEYARSLNPDLILLDLMLPKLDGHKVCQLLKADSRYRGIPIVMWSASGTQEDKDWAKKVGADGFIEKGAPIDDTLNVIKALL
ncbi:MAG: response regulator [Candidatus Omnitrophica bacterium]|nr:response regulator [Candidatus Omnitrophota bacterium]